jgi:plastocyanin
MNRTRSLVVALAALGAVPLASAGCLPSCEVGSTAFGYAPMATVIESGDNVTWTSLDLDAHTATSAQFCLNLGITAQAPGTAFFRIEGDALQATTNASGTWRTCREANALPDGSFALAYECLFHQPLQNGVLVVRP